MVLLISIGAFLSMMTLLLWLHQFVSADDRVLVERLDRLTGTMKTSTEDKTGLKGLRAVIYKVSKHFGSSKWESSLDHRLQQASLPVTVAEFIVFCLILTILGFEIVHLGSGGNLIFAVAGAFLFFWIPFFIVRACIKRRMKAFNHQLGDSLILISNSLRTGYSFLQSFDMVAREMQPPISVEFSRTVKEINLGITTEDALDNMAKRIDSNDLDLVITAVLIQRQVGGNLAELLDTLAHTIRERVKIRGHIQTLTAQGRISGFVVSLLPVGLGLAIYILNPEYITLLFIHAIGGKLLAAGVVSQIIGIVLVRRIVNIKV
jgi:tight adherence protein B